MTARRKTVNTVTPVDYKNKLLNLLVNFDFHNTETSFSDAAQNVGLTIEVANETANFNYSSETDLDRNVVFEIKVGDGEAMYLAMRETCDSYGNYAYYSRKFVRPVGTKVVQVFE